MMPISIGIGVKQVIRRWHLTIWIQVSKPGPLEREVLISVFRKEVLERKISYSKPSVVIMVQVQLFSYIYVLYSGHFCNKVYAIIYKSYSFEYTIKNFLKV